jgi:ankyrin repeat protein
MKAARHGNLEAVKYLVERGADVNAKDNDGKTPLMWAAEYDGEKGLNVVEYLIRHGADISRERVRNSLLQLAAEYGHLNTVKYLVGHGANVNAKDKNGKTPLIRAAYRGRLDVVKYLVEHGADVDIHAVRVARSESENVYNYLKWRLIVEYAKVVVPVLILMLGIGSYLVVRKRSNL